MKRRPTTVPLGIFSSGTTRDEDVGDAIASLLGDLRLSRADRKTVREFDRAMVAISRGGKKGEVAQDDLPDIVQDLWSALDNYLPDYTYAGSAEGDGACYGVWPALDRIEEDATFGDGDLVKVADLSQAGPGPSYAAVVSDHGNLTLYGRRGRNRWTYLWAVV